MMSAPESMYIAWGKDQFFFFNDTYAPILGPRLPDAVGTTLPLLWADVYEQVRPMVEEALAGRANRFDDIPFQMARQGAPEDTWWSFFFTPIYDESGDVQGMFCVTNETTERVLRARRLNLVEREHSSLTADVERRVAEQAMERGRIWRVSAELLAISSTGDYFESTNPAWQRALGWEASEIAAMPYPNFVHPEDVALTHRALVQARGEDGLIRLESRMRSKTGEYRWFSWSIVGEDGQVYCSARDITEEKDRARALEVAEDQLRQSQKMEAVGQLTGGIAHDFNNLLGGILGSLEVIQIRLQQHRHEGLERFITAATGATRRAAALTHRLLAFSRRQTLEPKPTDINRLIRGMEDLVSRTIGPSIQLIIEETDGVWPVFADPNQVDNALLNLCINARDAMPDGGTITIRTYNEMVSGEGVDGLIPGPYVRLSVSDSGVGMSPTVIARAFDPFFTTKPLGQGTGLGLSMIYGFAKQSGGDVWIDSEVGDGTTVSLLLPRFEQGDMVCADPVLAVPVSGNGESILVVDDDPDIRSLVVDSLTERGYAVWGASDGPAAMRLLQSLPPIDLLVTDVGLPGGMNGRQLGDAARMQRPDLRVLFITGYAEGAVLSHGHLGEYMGLLTKPFSLAELARRVDQMLPALSA